MTGKIIPKQIVLFLIAVILQQAAAAQQSQASGWRFHSFNAVGLLQGEGKAAFQVQSVNGVQHKNLSAGLGVALDYYRFKSVPVFADLRLYFGKANAQFFVYADPGVHYVWEKTEKQFGLRATYRPGFYAATGIGVKAGGKNGNGIVLSVGYSYKHVRYCEQSNTCNLQDYYTFDLNRLLLQIGFVF